MFMNYTIDSRLVLQSKNIFLCRVCSAPLSKEMMEFNYLDLKPKRPTADHYDWGDTQNVADTYVSFSRHGLDIDNDNIDDTSLVNLFR
jgi:hypothetical protein